MVHKLLPCSSECKASFSFCYFASAPDPTPGHDELPREADAGEVLNWLCHEMGNG